MTATSVRHPAVAGRFYPRDAASLREERSKELSVWLGPIVFYRCTRNSVK